MVVGNSVDQLVAVTAEFFGTHGGLVQIDEAVW